MKRVGVDDYQHDPLYPRIVRAVDDLLRRGPVVAPVDVLVGMGILAPDRLEEWRRGRVPYLERVVQGNLSRHARLLRLLRLHAHGLKLQPSRCAYASEGAGPRRPLRFTKTGDRRLEEAYATHLVWPGKRPFHQPKAERRDAPDGA